MARLVVLDASDPDAVRRFVDEAADALCGLDGAWSNLGVQIAGTAETVSTEELDRSWAINVRAHAVLCGAAIPHLRAAGGGAILVTAFLEAVPGLVPLGRISTPEEIAGLACFLLSEDAAYVTGHAFVADGGELLVV